MTSTNIPLAELNLDALFIEQSRRLGMITLGDVMDCRLDELSIKKDFSYTWYADLLALLREQGLLSDFQQRQL